MKTCRMILFTTFELCVIDKRVFYVNCNNSDIFLFIKYNNKQKKTLNSHMFVYIFRSEKYLNY